MEFGISWIKEYCDIDTNDVRTYSDKMTMSGTIVENSEPMGKDVSNVVVGHVLTCEKHPDSDHLMVCTVDVGAQAPLQIVTGAPNIAAGQYVPTALVGATLPGDITIKRGKLRGVESDGMMCSVEELGLTRGDFPDAPENGIYVFPESDEDGSDFATKYKPGTDVKPYFGLDDTIIEYELTSNRPDCQSVLGLAREAALTYGVDFRAPQIAVQAKADGQAADYVKVRIDNPTLCRRYTARVIKNVKIGPSPKWMRHRLASAGIRPINNIVDITNYVMMEYGQPMHAFDVRTLAGKQIIVRNAAEDEKFVTLDGNEHTLDASMLVIADADKAIALAGVMGGENSKVLDDVTTILFESANFDGPNVRITAKKVGLRTDASAKFEKGLDPNNTLDAVNRACQLVEMIGAGEVVPGVVDEYPNVREKRVLQYDIDWINRFLATDLSEAFCVDVFCRIGCEVDEKTKTVIIPTSRNDMEGQADLAEEVARVYGYNNIPVSLVSGTERVGGLSDAQQMRNRLCTVLEAAGLSQALIYSFESPSVFDKLGLPSDDARRNTVTISNPLGEEFSVMRTMCAPGMLNVLSLNYNRRNERAWMYEVGRVYLPKAQLIPHDPATNPKGTANLPTEINTISIGLYGGGADFYTLKGILEMLFDVCGLCGYEIRVSDEVYLHGGRQAKYLCEGRVLATLGEVHPSVQKAYGIGTRAYLAQVNLDLMLDHKVMVKTYKPLPKYPALNRDIAVRVAKSVTVGEMEAVIREIGGDILESVSLFDVYEGEQVGAGYKSVAFSLVFRHKEKTLEDKSVNRVMDKIVTGLRERYDAELRA